MRKIRIDPARSVLRPLGGGSYRDRMRVLALLLLAVGLATLAGPGAAADRETAAASAFRLQLFARQFDAPVLVTHAPGEAQSLYVVEQPGRVVRLRAGKRTVFLDVRRDVEYGGEQGLLGLAFHPKYASNRLLYVAYTSRDGRNTVARYRSNGRTALRSSRTILLAVPDPYGNHNGGQLAFGRDGMLYTTIGDGGSGGDPEDRAQDMGSQFGKLLRLDVSKSGADWDDRRARPAQRLAVLVRSRDRRPLPRRRRPGRDRGDQLHAAGQPRPGELRLGPLRGLTPLRGRRAGPRASSSSRSTSTGTARALLGHRRPRLPWRGGPTGARALHLRRLLQRHRLEPDRPLRRGDGTSAASSSRSRD